VNSEAGNGDLRVGVVGVGYLGQHHARIYSTIPDVTLVGIADAKPGRAADIAGKYGGEPFEDHKALLGKVDAVSVATPTQFHHQVAAEFLDRGTAVLVEKPITATLPEADSLIQAAEKHGALLAVGHTERFNPATEALIERARNPRFIEAHRLGTFAGRSLDVDVVLDLMIHDIDLVLALTRGSSVKSVDAVGVSALTPKVDIANARIRFSNGCVANLTASRISTSKVRKVRVFTNDAYLSSDCANQSLEQFSLDRAVAPGAMPKIRQESPSLINDEPLARELRAFVSAAKGGKPFAVGGKEGRQALAIALAVAERIEEARLESAG
jgi:predicted dehydrogenase